MPGPFCSQVSKKIAKDFVPSAIQVRFAGCKGVLTVDPRLPGNKAVFRPSMRKFESSHRRLEVLQTSRPQVVFLNHQLVMLLSNLGIPDDVFMNLQRNMLDKLAGESRGRKYGKSVKRKYRVVAVTSLSKTPRRQGLRKKKLLYPCWY